MSSPAAPSTTASNQFPCPSARPIAPAATELKHEIALPIHLRGKWAIPAGNTRRPWPLSRLRILVAVLGCLGLASSFGHGNSTAIEPNGYGFFIGANGIGDSRLRGAANDAVSVAHRYVEELAIINPTNAVLVLQGEAPLLGAKMESQLGILARRGVRILTNQPAARVETEWRELISNIKKSSLTNSFVLCFASGHGVEHAGSPYLFVPNAESQPEHPKFPGEYLSIQNITADLSTLPPGWSRLLLLDACRKLLRAKDATSTRQQPGPEFYAALTNSPGILVLASCEPGQASYEDSELGLGMFTAQYLRLTREIPTKDGIIRLKDILVPLRENIKSKSLTRGGGDQLPTIFEAKGGIMGMPVGISATVPQVRARLNAKIQLARKTLSQAKSSNSIRDTTYKDVSEFLHKVKGLEKRWEIIERIEETLGSSDLPEAGHAFERWWDNYLMENNKPVVTKDPDAGLKSVNPSTSIALLASETSEATPTLSEMTLKAIQAIEQSLSTNGRVSLKVLPRLMETNLIDVIKPTSDPSYRTYNQGKQVDYDQPSFGKYYPRRYLPLLVSELGPIAPSFLVHLKIESTTNLKPLGRDNPDPDYVAEWKLVPVTSGAKAMSWRLPLTLQQLAKIPQPNNNLSSRAEHLPIIVQRITAAVAGTIIDELIAQQRQNTAETSERIPSPSP